MVKYRRDISFDLKESEGNSDIQVKKEREICMSGESILIEPLVPLKRIVLNVSFEI